MHGNTDLQKRKLIGGAEIFGSLGEAELDFIAANSSEAAFGEGEIVFEEGEAGEALFIVASGNVGIERLSPDGAASRIAELVAGDCFGELELLTQGRRTARARTLSPARLLRFPVAGASLHSVMESRPAVSAKLMRSLLAAVSGRIRKANAMLKENSPLVRELRRQVYGDKLSGLNNRTWLEESLGSLCTSGPLALLMFKPDNFKAINDSFGHDAGDRVIILMASEIRAYEAEGATPFRFAGNELGLVIPGAGRAAGRAAAAALAARLTALDLAAALGDCAPAADAPRLSISVGVALHPDHGSSAAQLIAAVNELPLAGRARGGNQILFPEDAS